MRRRGKKRIQLDLRYFRRYPKEAACTVFFSHQSCAAKMLDHSFNGLSIIIEDPPRIVPGDHLTVEITDLDIRQKGRVQWTASADAGLRLGIAKTGMLLGSFRHFALSDILIGLHRALKTGVLTIWRGSIIKKLYIRNGDLIYASSNQETDRLGRILLQEKKLTEEHYHEAMVEEKKTGLHHSEALIRSGYLKPEHLVSVLKLQAHTIIGSIFLLKNAQFSFREGPFSGRDVLTLKLSVSDSLYHELKKHADTNLVKEYLFDRIVDFSASPLKLFEHITLDEQDRAIVSLVDGKTTIEEITRLAPYDQNAVLQAVYALLEARILEIQMDGGLSQGIAFEDLVEKIQDVPDAAIMKIEKMHSEYKKLSYYDILGIHQSATVDEIKKAYFKLAKEFHPDLHFNLAGNVKNKLLEIFVYMTEAYLVLKEPQKRKEYLHTNDRQRSDQINPTKNEEIAEARYLEGKARFRKKQFEEAAHSFASAIYYDNSEAKYHFHYGCALREMGRYKDALEELNKALALQPSDPDALAEIGYVYSKLGFPLRARGYFKKVLEKQPSHARAAEGMRMINKL